MGEAPQPGQRCDLQTVAAHHRGALRPCRAAQLVTNDATAVRRFHAESGSGLICKVFGSNAITEHGTTKVAYTHRL
ncbi:MAG: hypothetical protein ACRDRO_17180, partial [Pseudonocardiaceae bacterium]